jgi:hypothetical protein
MNKVTEISGLITCQQTGKIGDPILKNTEKLKGSLKDGH